MAVREVLSWLQENPIKTSMEEQEEEEGDRELLKVFESSSSVTYNDSSVTFFLEEGRVEEWRSTLQEYFKDEDTKEKEGEHSVQFMHPMWPLVGQEGKRKVDSLSVTLYPSCSEPKVLVQGKLYLHFVTQVLPRMALSLGKDNTQIKAILGGEVEEPEVKEAENSKKCDNSDMNTVNNSIKRLEIAFMEKMEASVQYQVATQKELKGMKAEVETLKEEVKSMNNSAPRVAQPQGEGSVQTLSSKIETSTKEIKSKIDELKTSVKKVEETTMETFKDVKKLRTSHDEVMSLITKLHSRLDPIQESLSRSSLLVNGESPASSKVQEEVATPVEEEVEVVQVRQRKGIIFTSSVARELNIEQFEKDTKSKVEKVETYRIKPKEKCKDPEAHVSSMVKEHMAKDHDFAVFVVGSNDITDLKPELESSDVLEKCEMLAHKLVDAAVGVATEYSTEVFISELTPRYDSKEKDGLGPLATLSMVTNTFLVKKVKEVRSETVRLHLINQRSLARPKGEEQDKVYERDGRHLTKEGLHLITSNIISSLRTIYKDIPEVKVEEVKEVKNPPAPKVKVPQKVKGGPVPQDPRHLPQGTPRPPQGTPRPHFGANRPPGGQFQPWVGQSPPPRLPPRHLLPPREQVAPPHQWDPREPQYPAPQGHLGALYPAPQGGPRPLGPDYPYYGPPPPARRLGHHYTPQYYDYDGGYF